MNVLLGPDRIDYTQSIETWYCETIPLSCFPRHLIGQGSLNQQSKSVAPPYWPSLMFRQLSGLR